MSHLALDWHVVGWIMGGVAVALLLLYVFYRQSRCPKGGKHEWIISGQFNECIKCKTLRLIIINWDDDGDEDDF